MRFSGGRAFEILVKQHPEMSLFVKHVADKQQSRATNPCFSMTLRYTLPCLVPSLVMHFGGVSEKKIRSDHVTQNALAAQNNEAYGQANGRQSFCTVLRYHLKHWTQEFFHWPFSN